MIIRRTRDKIRWYRYKNGLRQRDVAECAGLDRGTYSNYETAERDYYPIEKMQKIAELLSVPVTELLDDFNLFLYDEQGRQIKEIRQHRNMTQAEFAGRLGVPIARLKAWEQDKVQISKSTWEKIRSRG